MLFFPEKWNSETSASLDRIDSSLGYIEENVQWVHKDVNMMKRIYDNNYFIKMCKLIAENCAGNACEIDIEIIKKDLTKIMEEKDYILVAST